VIDFIRFIYLFNYILYSLYSIVPLFRENTYAYGNLFCSTRVNAFFLCAQIKRALRQPHHFHGTSEQKDKTPTKTRMVACFSHPAPPLHITEQLLNKQQNQGKPTIGYLTKGKNYETMAFQ